MAHSLPCRIVLAPLTTEGAKGKKNRKWKKKHSVVIERRYTWETAGSRKGRQVGLEKSSPACPVSSGRKLVWPKEGGKLPTCPREMCPKPLPKLDTLSDQTHLTLKFKKS